LYLYVGTYYFIIKYYYRKFLANLNFEINIGIVN
jgi:hypothetical protein